MHYNMNVKVIKRYRNRRLYDTETKQFILLEDLLRMVKADQQFKAFDSDSGEDITVSVLTSIISGNASQWADGEGSLDVLRAVIKTGGNKSMSLLKNTVLAGVGFAALTRKKAEGLVESLVKSGEVEKSDKKEAVLELLEKAEKTTRDASAKFVKQFEKSKDNLMMAKKKDFDSLTQKVDKLAKAIARIEKKLK